MKSNYKIPLMIIAALITVIGLVTGKFYSFLFGSPWAFFLRKKKQ